MWISFSIQVLSGSQLCSEITISIFYMWRESCFLVSWSLFFIVVKSSVFILHCLISLIHQWNEKVSMRKRKSANSNVEAQFRPCIVHTYPNLLCNSNCQIAAYKRICMKKTKKKKKKMWWEIYTLNKTQRNMFHVWKLVRRIKYKLITNFQVLKRPQKKRHSIETITMTSWTLKNDCN